MKFGKEAILEYVTDPAKMERVDELTEEQIDAISGYTLTEERHAILEENNLWDLRVIVFRRLMDWATKEADAIQQEIFDFIDDPTFVDYPDFLSDPALLAVAKIEHQNNHARNFTDFRDVEAEILGARITEDKFGTQRVQVLVTHNQIHSTPNDRYSNFMNFSQEEYGIPPVFKIGYLKLNPGGVRGRGGEMYIGMTSPYPGQWGRSQHTEVNIGNLTDDQETLDAMNVIRTGADQADSTEAGATE